MHWPFAKRYRSFYIPLCALKLFHYRINLQQQNYWNGSAFRNDFGEMNVMKYMSETTISEWIWMYWVFHWPHASIFLRKKSLNIFVSKRKFSFDIEKIILKECAKNSQVHLCDCTYQSKNHLCEIFVWLRMKMSENRVVWNDWNRFILMNSVAYLKWCETYFCRLKKRITKTLIEKEMFFF